MATSEFSHILAAIIILALISGSGFIFDLKFEEIPLFLIFSTIIIALSVITKKTIAYMLDADIEHEIWKLYHYGFHPSSHFKKPIPAGAIIPILLAVLSLGAIKFTALLTYEARALKYRASKRFGFYSFTEMTDWHNGIIGASGIFFILLLSLISYLLPIPNLEYLAKMSAYYAFWNLLPISKLDGAQIFFGSRIVWTVLFAIAAIFTVFAIITP